MDGPKDRWDIQSHCRVHHGNAIINSCTMGYLELIAGLWVF